MLALVRRVKNASVTVEGKVVGAIGRGLLLYIGLEKTDTESQCLEIAAKIPKLRLFEGPEAELSVKDIRGGILSVSQFTLSADTKKGNRPSFTRAMGSAEAKPLFDFFNGALAKEFGSKVETGIFGAYMFISAEDDGPYTIIIDTNHQ